MLSALMATSRAVSRLGGTRVTKPAEPGALLFNPKNIISVLGKVDYLKLPLLAVELGLENDLSEIEAAQLPSQVKKRLAEKWLQSSQGCASWEVLACALRSPIVREDKLASYLEKWYVRRHSETSTLSSSSSEPYSPRSPISPVSSSTEEKVASKMRALAEVDVRDSFGNLVSILASKLSEKQSRNELDIKSFRLYLSSIFPPKSLPNTVDILLTFQDINAQELWDYCQYEIVERIGTRYLPDDKELTTAVNEHSEMVNNYLATQSIAKYIEQSDIELRTLRPDIGRTRNSKHYYDQLAITLCDVSIRRKTLKYVRDQWKGIKREFHICECNALLDRICEGSIVIMWLIPPSASEVILKPQPWSAIRFIQKELIVNMILNDTCIYDEQDSKKLLELCSDGGYDSVTSLLQSKDKGAAINATFEEVFEGKSALMLVCERGHISLLLTVLECEAEVNFQHEVTGETALILAAKHGHLRVVRFLLAYGGDPELKDHLGRNASELAKEEDHEIVSEELCKGKPKGKIRYRNVLQHFSDKMEEATDFLFAPGFKLAYRATKSLIGASRSNDLGSVKYIIDHAKNLDINVRESDKLGWSALMWATERNNLEMVELLLTNKADTNIVAKSNQWTALMLATRQGNLRIVKTLLDHGADPNAQNSKGFSSVSLAVYEHHTEIAMLLVHRGAEVNVVEESGNSPLTHASVENDMELVNLFCDHGANVNHQGVKGWSPLMEAARKGYKDIVEELIRRGADLNMRTEAGESAIHAATVKGHVEVVKVLATYEADLNMPNKDGLTALMVAADKGYQSIVEALLVGGVDVDYKHQITGWPAIFFAAKNGRVNILRKLLEKGAGIELESGLKLVDVASFFKRKAIIDEINKKPPTQLPHTLPQPTPSVPHEVPGIESGLGGIELTSFTKKEAGIDEPTKFDSATRPMIKESHDHKAIVSEGVEVKQEKPEELEIGVKDEPKSEAKEPSSPSLASDAGGTVHPEVSISDSEITTESRLDVEEAHDVQMPKSPVDVHIMLPPKVEVSITSTTEEPTEQPEPAPDILQPLSGQDAPTTTQSVPEEVESQPAQVTQDIAEIAKIYELLFKALDQRMNVENVKKSSRKGVADIHRLTNQEEIAS